MSFTRLRPLLIGLSVLLTLVFVVWMVWRNEQTIANGRDAFVELRPVDPLSLVQGYYMALNMQVDLQPREGLGIADARAVFTLDGRGVATASRWLDLGEGGEQGRGDASADLSADEVILRVGEAGRRLSVKPDSFLFEDGQAETYEGARYGHFRVLADGRSVLIGLTDGDLQPLVPVKRRIEAAASTVR